MFRKLNNQNLENVWRPAEEQFGGSGSYGNGGAMRVAPVPLFAHKNYDLMLDIAEKSTRLTHTHPLGINGALLQVSYPHKMLMVPTVSVYSPNSFFFFFYRLLPFIYV